MTTSTTIAESLAVRLKQARQDVFQQRVLLEQAKDSERLTRRNVETDVRQGKPFREAKNEGERKAVLAAELDADRIYQQAQARVTTLEMARDEAILRLEQAEDDWRAYAYTVMERIADGRLVTSNSEQAMERLTDRLVAAITAQRR